MMRMLVIVLVGATVCGGTAHAATPAPPNLSIKVDDGTRRASVGARSTYLVKIDSKERKGTKATVRMMLPRGMRFVSADHGGRISGGSVVWQTTLPGSALTALSFSGDFGEVPADVRALAATACVEVPGHRSPVVCAADIDALSADGGFPVPILIGGIVVLLAMSGAGTWLFARRRRGSEAETSLQVSLIP
ncbi:MAG: hypothetical protein ABIS86_08730 [Streptosporangiaceae bacterium]